MTHLNVEHEPDAWHEPSEITRAVFFGLGSDGTVGANKNTVKIIGSETALYAQGYFVYDSKKAGSTTVSHLRFGPNPISSAYLIQKANFIGVHDFGAFDRQDVLGLAESRATLLINSEYSEADTWKRLPTEAQQQIIEKDLEVWLIDGYRVARENGLGKRINTVLQTGFFVLSGLLDERQAITAIKEAVASTYGKRGRLVLDRNFAAIDAAASALRRLKVPDEPILGSGRPPAVPTIAPDFVQRVTGRIIAGEGDSLPVSAFPVDGTFPTGTSRWEKRTIASEIPIWDPEICIDCGRCALVCPHAAIRIKSVPAKELGGAPSTFRHKKWKDKSDPTRRGIIQVAPDDCTGCGVCVSICPAKSKTEVRHKSINMEPIAEHVEPERINFEYFLDLPEHTRTTLKLDSVKGSQLAQPLFEFSGACAGCGETPYLKLLTQLMGDRMVVANATGCSSIYGGNLPTTPWTTDEDGRGPAWANSLFEDNAEFGLGIRLALDHHAAAAQRLLAELAPEVGPLATRMLQNEQRNEESIADQRTWLTELRAWLNFNPGPIADRLASLCHHLVDRSVWLVGGDGWAYDIGFGGLDHVLASRPRCQHSCIGHRGLLEHWRANVQSNTKSCHRQVLLRRETNSQEGSGHDRHGSWRCVRRSHRHGSEHDPDSKGTQRSCSSPGSLAGHCLQPMHRPRNRHDRHDGSPEDGGRQRLLAVVPLRSDTGSLWGPRIAFGQPQTSCAVPQVRTNRGQIRNAGALRSGGCERTVHVGTRGHRRSLAPL